MTAFRVYIGDLEDPDFHWEGGNWSCNIPKSLTDNFPPGKLGSSGTFFAIIKAIESGKYRGKRTDWGASVARVNKQQIIDFISERFAGDPAYEDKSEMPHLRERLQLVVSQVRALDPKKEYGLCAVDDG
jgi:hypothetical protein